MNNTITMKVCADTSDIERARDILKECSSIAKSMGLNKRQIKKLLKVKITENKSY